MPDSLLESYFNDWLQGPWTAAYVERHLGTERLPKSEVISMMQQHADFPFLRRWKLIGNARSVRRSRNCAKLVAAYKVCEKALHLGRFILQQNIENISTLLK